MRLKMIRKAYCAGLFYPQNPQGLRESMHKFFAPFLHGENTAGKHTAGEAGLVPVRICLLPHAGHIYSGAVTAKTLAEIVLPSKLIMLCPNHTGLGRHGAVWDRGGFETPLGIVPAAEDTAAALLRYPCFAADTAAHIREHSVEVILPFLQYLYGDSLSIVPVGLAGLENLDAMAAAVAECMRADSKVGLVVSSDMNHFASEKENRRKDFLALEALRSLDEKVLIQTVIDNDISMCGVLGAYIGIRAAKALGLRECRIAGYDTSASASGDSSRVVGYAGAYFL